MKKGCDLIVGQRALKARFQIGAGTLTRLVEEEGLPIFKLPQANNTRDLWITSGKLIEEWLAEKIRQSKLN